MLGYKSDVEGDYSEHLSKLVVTFGKHAELTVMLLQSGPSRRTCSCTPRPPTRSTLSFRPTSSLATPSKLTPLPGPIGNGSTDRLLPLARSFLVMLGSTSDTSAPFSIVGHASSPTGTESASAPAATAKHTGASPVAANVRQFVKRIRGASSPSEK